MIDRSAKTRIILLSTAMLLMVGVLIVQLIRVQFGPYAPVFAARETIPLGRVEKIAPPRGLIYDRDGQPLAINVSMYYLEIEVRQLTAESKSSIALVVSRLLDIPQEDLEEQLNRDWESQGKVRIRLTRPTENDSRWPAIADQGAADIITAFLMDPDAPDMSGLSLEPTIRRFYPAGTMAGHVLGFVNQEGRGFFGVEGYYDDWLSGKEIMVEHALIPLEARLQPDPPAGVNLVLTIDLDVQLAAEQALEREIQSSRAESGQVIVMDPRTGEILALASWPLLDPNDYESWLLQDEDVVHVINPAVSGSFEPGSTFKILTMAAALQEDVVQPDDTFLDTGEIEVGGVVIRNWNSESWGPQTMVGCMQHSLNVCLAHVAAERLGTASFYNYLQDFGVGRLTGVDLAGEVTGQLRTHRHPGWTQVDIGTNSFGQGLSMTPIQLLAAVSAIANDGVMVQPHVVRQIASSKGVYLPKTTVLGRPIDSDTAETLEEMLVESLQSEGRLGQIDGYHMAGKTGTSQIPTEYGYDPHLTVASFIGWGPVEDPEFIIFVRLDKPRTSPWGSVIAAPVFQELAQRMVVLLDIPPMLVFEESSDGT